MDASISVIIPTYNMASFLPEAVQSVLNNSFTDVELIIIDDGSTDTTAEVVRGLQEKAQIPIRYHKVTHRGKAGCLNRIFDGLSVNGSHVVFMDADDLLPPHSLHVRYEAITHSQCDFIVSAFAVKTLQGKTLETRRLNKASQRRNLIQRFFFAHKSPFHLNATILSRGLLLKTGAFDERLRRGQEVDYSIRLLKSARRFSILPRVVYYYRKYHRPVGRRLKIRLQTMRCRHTQISKHLQGLQRVKAIVLHTFLDTAKLFYELLRNYKT